MVPGLYDSYLSCLEQPGMEMCQRGSRYAAAAPEGSLDPGVPPAPFRAAVRQPGCQLKGDKQSSGFYPNRKNPEGPLEPSGF